MSQSVRYQRLVCVDDHNSSGSEDCSQEAEEGATWCECPPCPSPGEALDEDTHDLLDTDAAAPPAQQQRRQAVARHHASAFFDGDAVMSCWEKLLGFEIDSSCFDGFILNQEGRGFAQRQFRIFKAWYNRQTTMENKAALESLVSSLDATTYALHNIKMDGKSVLWSTAVELHAFAQICMNDGEWAPHVKEDHLIGQRDRQEKTLLRTLMRFLADDVGNEFRKQDVNLTEKLPGELEDRERVKDFVKHLATLARSPVSFDHGLLKIKFGEHRLRTAKSDVLAKLNRIGEGQKSELSGTDCVALLMTEKQQMKDAKEMFKAIDDDKVAAIIRHALLLHLACDTTRIWWRESQMAKALQIGLSQMAAEENYAAVIYMMKKATTLEKEIQKGFWTRQEESEDVFPWLGLPLDLLGPYVMAMKGDSSTMFQFVRAMQAVQSKVLPSFRAKLKRLETILQEQVTVGGHYMGSLGATMLSGASIALFYVADQAKKTQMDEHLHHVWGNLTNPGAVANALHVLLADNSTRSV